MTTSTTDEEIGAVEAAVRARTSPDVIRDRLNRGIIKGRKLLHVWLVDVPSLNAYIAVNR